MAVTKQKQDPKNGEITTTIETITPAIANEMLSKQVANRGINMRVLSGYTTTMKAGKWFENTGEAIKFNVNDELTDGQHRLTALVRAGVTLNFLVVRGLPVEAFTYLDQGKTRTSADVLHLEGVPKAVAVGAIISKYLMLCSNVAAEHRGQKMHMGITNNDILKAYKKHADYWQELETKSRYWYKDIEQALHQSILGGFYAFLSDIDQEAAEEFFSMLTTGNGIKSKFHPVAQLRELLFSAKRQTGIRFTTTYVRAVFIKAWNYYRTGAKLNNLTYNSQIEDFPKPI